MTYAEVEFLKAEAAERGLGGQTGAAAHYNAGVRASILQWGGTDAEADAYLAKPGVAYVAGATGLKQIGLQKWISMFTQGNEAWAEWRRTGNPATVKMGPKAYPDVPEIPRRIPYPSNEQTVNAASLDGGGRASGCGHLPHAHLVGQVGASQLLNSRAGHSSSTGVPRFLTDRRRLRVSAASSSLPFFITTRITGPERAAPPNLFIAAAAFRYRTSCTVAT